MNQEELNELCREWQRILRLQDWEIVVKLVSAREMIHLGASGQCDDHPAKRRVIIKILCDDDRGTTEWWELFSNDQEISLVHELLHVHLLPFAPDDWDSPEGIALEQVIHAVSSALVALKRGAT